MFGFLALSAANQSRFSPGPGRTAYILIVLTCRKTLLINQSISILLSNRQKSIEVKKIIEAKLA